MDDGIISGCKADGNGGAIFSYVDSGSNEVNLTGGTIEGNSAKIGGGVYIDCYTVVEPTVAPPVQGSDCLLYTSNQQFERTDRIASEIMRETEKIIREDVSDPRTDCMFSITHVDVTRDLRYAKVYVSIYEEEKRAPMMKALKTAAGFIRHNLGRRVQLRYTPELVFELDTTIEYGVHIASLINQVRKTEESRSDDAGEAGI